MVCPIEKLLSFFPYVYYQILTSVLMKMTHLYQNRLNLCVSPNSEIKFLNLR